MDEPTDLPDGTEVELLSLDPGDWLDEADRAALHEALRQSGADVAAGRLVDAEEILRELNIGGRAQARAGVGTVVHVYRDGEAYEAQRPSRDSWKIELYYARLSS